VERKPNVGRESIGLERDSQYARSLIEASPDPMVVISPEGKITDVNQATLKITGVDREHLIGTDFSAYVTDPDKARQGYLQVFAEGSLTNFPLIIRALDGKLTDVLLNASVYQDTQGNVCGVFATARDNTEQKKASLDRDAAAQREIENNFFHVMESHPEAFLLVDEMGIIVYENGAARTLFAFQPEKMLGSAVESLIPSRLRAQHSGLREKYSANPIAKLMAERPGIFARKKDGTEFPVEVSLFPVQTPTGPQVAVSIRDITKENQASQSVRDMASIIESSNDSIASGNMEMIFTSWNAAAERMYGYTAAEMIGQPFSRLVAPEYANEDTNNMADLLDGNKIEPYETSRIRKDGNAIEISLTVSPIYDEIGAVIGSSGIARDITIEKQVILQLQELNDLRNEFVAVIAHDLRAPAASISGFAHFLTDEWTAIDEGKKLEYLQIIAKNTDALAEFIEDVLQVARIEAGEFTYHISPFSIHALAQRALDEVAGPNNDRRLELITPNDLPLVLGDEQRQQQILTNILSNALKFSPAQAPIVVELSKIGDWVQVAVTDRGVGIAEEDLAKLFRKSERLLKSGNPITSGNGLGLFICKTLVEAQGGRIWCKSTRGQGSTFIFTIPVVP